MSCKGRASWDDTRTYTVSRPGPNEIALNVIRVLEGRIGWNRP